VFEKDVECPTGDASVVSAARSSSAELESLKTKLRWGAGPHTRFDCKDHPMEAAPLVAVLDEWVPRTPDS